MKKVLIFYAILVIVIVVFAISRGINLFNFNFFGTFQGAKSSVTINKKTYNVTLAKTDKEKMVGLSGRNNLPSNSGMLFIFDTKEKHAFWMNDMKFPIDIIFINDNKIVDFVENALPPANGQLPETLPIYKPSSDINYVLEVNAKEISKNNFKRGDSVTFKEVK